MNEQWKRLIEAERRVARLESGLSRTNRNVVSVQGQIQNGSQNITNPFGSGGGGGGGTGAVHAFPSEYEMWVEWDVVPSLKTGASSNPTADVTALAEAVSFLETGVTMNLSNNDGYINTWLWDANSNRPLMYLSLESQATTSISGDLQFWTSDFTLSLLGDGNFMADAKIDSGAWTELFSAEIVAQEASPELPIRMACGFPRRNGIGSKIGSASVAAYRVETSNDDFTYGPTRGESGTWSFEMECPATTYHNAGSGTIFLRWGTGESFAYSGGSPDDLPADAFDGGSPDDLPADIIDGGTI